MSDEPYVEPHPLVETCLLLWRIRPTEEHALVRRQRQAVRRTFEIHRASLAADPTATPDDLATLDRLIERADRTRGFRSDAEEQRRLERRRALTRERVRRLRARRAKA
jgi:hypothetical protein